MARRLVGLETEYAFTALGPGGAPLDREAALNGFMGLARSRLRHLRDRNSAGGFFLENGSRFYVDCGHHPELGTPECLDPWDVVRYVLAGERILARLADELVANDREVDEVVLLKCNVDYSGERSTWGCHESYLHRANPRAIPKQIIPHLVSRVIYTGAGGFNARSEKLKFTLSPRVSHLVRTVSDESTHARGIFHTKNESLSSDGYHRLHILCGESLCSETATWLKTGSTALVVAMIEGGLRPGDAVELSSPLPAMRRFAQDETCSAAVAATNEKRLTAIDIQRHYLSLAQAHVHEPFMPSWAGDVLVVWGAILDRLEQGAPDSVATVLDWAIKLALYRDRVRRRGMSWDRLDPSSGLRQELLEIDARFGQLGERGIFGAMDRAGVLAHHVSGVDRIEDAVCTPPADGRARLRGQCIKRFAGTGARYTSDWQGVWDRQRGRFLDLSNPFETEERWEDRPEPDWSDLGAYAREAVAFLQAGRGRRRTSEGPSAPS